MRPMNDENPPIAHRKWLDNGICVDEPLYTCPNDKGKIPGHLNMVRYYAGQLIKELPASLRERGSIGLKPPHSGTIWGNFP